MIEVLAGILLMATIGGLLMWFAHHEDPECRDEAGGFYAVVFFVGIVFVFGAGLSSVSWERSSAPAGSDSSCLRSCSATLSGWERGRSLRARPRPQREGLDRRRPRSKTEQVWLLDIQLSP